MKNMRGRFRRFWSDMRLERKLLVSYILDVYKRQLLDTYRRLFPFALVHFSL